MRTPWLTGLLIALPCAALAQSRTALTSPPTPVSSDSALHQAASQQIASQHIAIQQTATQQTASDEATSDKAAPQAQPTLDDRFQEFINDSVESPLFYVQAIGSGTIDQLGHFPDEWEGAAGYAKRNAARLGQAFAGDAIGHATAAVLHHRVAYDACRCTGLARVKHAVSRAFVSLKSDGSGRAPNWSLWTSKYAAAGLANAWYPPSYRVADVLVQGTAGLGASAGLNILKEFAPELLRIGHLK